MSFLAAVATNASSSSNSSSSASSAAPQSKAQFAGPAVDNSVLLFNVDVFLLCCVALFVLLLLPRAAIRFTHKREWIDGHFLRSIYLDNQPSVVRRPSAKRQDVISPMSPAHIPELKGQGMGEGAESDYGHGTSYGHGLWGGATTAESHTYVTHADVLRKASTASGRERRRQNVPTHMSGWSTMLPTLAAYLRINIRPNLTIGKFFVLMGYFGVMLYAGLFMSNPLSDPIRAGFLAVSQIPAIVLLGTKNNLVGLLIGFGYERVSVSFIFPHPLALPRLRVRRFVPSVS